MKNYLVFDIETTELRAAEGDCVTCICAVAIGEGEQWFTKAGTDESEIIFEFLQFLGKHKDYRIISANGRDFDIPFLLIRAYTNEIDFSLAFSLFGKDHFDLINDITDKKVSLNNLAALYGFYKKSGDGLLAIKLFQEEKFAELITYCSDDVRLSQKIYLKYWEIRYGN